MKWPILLLVAFLAACATEPTRQNFVWHKEGSSDEQFRADLGQCRAQALSSTGGEITMGAVRIVESCLQGKGWEKDPS